MNTSQYIAHSRHALCAAALALSGLFVHARENEVEHQEIERSIVLTRTGAAPSNAVGTAQLEIGHRSAARSNRIEIHTSGLAAGVYVVTVFDRSGSNSLVLGGFGSSTGVSTNDSSDDSIHDSTDDSGHHRGRGGRKSSDDALRHGSDDDGEGEVTFAVPDSINALELGRLSITDSTGAEMLLGNFSEVATNSSGHLSCRAVAVNGSADDDASGSASISGRIRRGRGTGQFTLTGKNLPPRAELTLDINGEDRGVVATDRHGRLRVRRSHKSLDVFSISTVTVRDDSGGVLLTAHF